MRNHVASGGLALVSWVLLAVAIVSEVTASLCLKAALQHPWFYAVVGLGYVLSFVMLSQVLGRGMPLGMAYGIWAACGVVLTALASWAVFREPLTLLMGLGFLLVAGGVLLIELGAGH